VLDVEGGAEWVERVVPRCGALARAEEAIRELLSIVGQNCANAEWTGALEIGMKASCVGRCFCCENAIEDPSGRAVDGREEVTRRGFIRHLTQILHVDMDVAGLIGFEAAGFGRPALVCRSRRLWFGARITLAAPVKLLHTHARTLLHYIPLLTFRVANFFIRHPPDPKTGTVPRSGPPRRKSRRREQ